MTHKTWNVNCIHVMLPYVYFSDQMYMNIKGYGY